jgi:hypothetical protein
MLEKLPLILAMSAAGKFAGMVVPELASMAEKYALTAAAIETRSFANG